MAALALALGACAPDSGGSSGTGGDGAAGKGGEAGSGALGSGGAATGGAGPGGAAGGAAGATATGGASALGGATGHGGQSGQGGSATGGTAGHAQAGAGGAGGTAGGAGAAGSGGTSGHGGFAGTGGSGGSGGSGGMSGHGGHGGGGAGAGGAAGSAGYSPCPTNGSACKILPLGDSITHGYASSDDAGYRSQLFKLVLAANQKATFTGSLANGPTQVSGQTFPRNHEGHDGWGISEVNPNSGGSAGLTTVIPTPAFSGSSGGTPNIILLHIGTNDQGTYSATQMESDLRGLLDKITAAAPDALVVVAQIIPLGYGTNAVIKAYDQAIPGIVQAEVAAGKHVAVVDMYTGFNTSTMIGSDSVHPNDSGYQFMANRWYGAIGSLLP
jgi:lysophospholipase L1-like esterase